VRGGEIFSGFVIFQGLAPRKISLPVRRPASARRVAFRPPAMAEPSFETSGRGAVGGGGIKAASKAFLQAFPNLACFCPSFSKQSFGHFVGFQWVARAKNQKVPPPNFFVPPASHRPPSRCRRARFRRRATHGVWCVSIGGRWRPRCTEWARSWRRGVPDRWNSKSSTNSGLQKEISVVLA
jgi:hypothetical protein